MHKYYNNNKFSMKDVYEGTILIPLNNDYLQCERLIYEKFMMHFAEKDIKNGTLGQKIRSYHKKGDIWHKALFERPIDRIMQLLQYENDNNDNIFEVETKDMKPHCNLIEKKNEYEIICDLPGINKNNINVNFHSENGVIEIEGKRENEENKETNEKNYIHLEEINYGNYYRCFDLSKSININNQDIKAKHDNGVLTLYIPKNNNLLSKDSQYRVQIA